MRLCDIAKKHHKTNSEFYITDSFSKIDGSALGALDTGETWSVSGTWDVVGGRARVVSSSGQYNGAAVIAPSPDVEVGVTFVNAGSVREHRLFLRGGLFVIVGSGALSLKKYTTSETTLGTYGFTPTDNLLVKVIIEGTLIKVYLNGVLRITATESTDFLTSKSFGIAVYGSGGQLFDSFYCKSISTSLNILASDKFNRVNTTTAGLGNADTGQAWAYLGTISILDSKAYPYAKDVDACMASLTVGKANVLVECDCIYGSNIGISFRRSGAGYAAGFYMAHISDKLYLKKHTAYWTDTILGSYDFTPVIGTTYKLRVIANESLLSVYLDGVLRIQLTDTYSLTNTYHGIFSQTAGGANKFDNFIIADAPI